MYTYQTSPLIAVEVAHEEVAKVRKTGNNKSLKVGFYSHEDTERTIWETTDGKIVEITLFCEVPETRNLLMSVPFRKDLHFVGLLNRQITEAANKDEAEYFSYLFKLNNETQFVSNPNIIRNNENCKAIVQMGMRAVPFILKGMQQYLETDAGYPGYWALMYLPEMTGERPDFGSSVEQNKGFVAIKVRQVCEVWVNWGKSKGILNV